MVRRRHTAEPTSSHAAQVSLLAIREKELNFYVTNCQSIGTQASAWYAHNGSQVQSMAASPSRWWARTSDELALASASVKACSASATGGATASVPPRVWSYQAEGSLVSMTCLGFARVCLLQLSVHLAVAAASVCVLACSNM